MKDYIFWSAIIIGVWVCGIRIGIMIERDRLLRKSKPKAKAIMRSPKDDEWQYKPANILHNPAEQEYPMAVHVGLHKNAEEIVTK